mgnify:FL=1
MAQLILIILFSIQAMLCNSDYSRSIEQKTIRISFTIDDSITNVANKFDVRFINGNDTLMGMTDSIFLRLPDLEKDSIYDVSFSYESYRLYFKDMPRTMIIPEQEIEWKFGIDNRPFNNLLGLLPYHEYQNDTTTKKLIYLQFNPFEFGDGIQLVQKVR